MVYTLLKSCLISKLLLKKLWDVKTSHRGLLANEGKFSAKLQNVIYISLSQSSNYLL